MSIEPRTPAPEPWGSAADSARGRSLNTGSDLDLDLKQTTNWQRLVEPVARLGTPSEMTDPATGQTNRLRFLQAGLRQRGAPVVFYATKVALALGLPLLAALVFWLISALPVRLSPNGAGATLWHAPSGMTLAFMLLASAAVGVLMPEAWLRRRTVARQRELFEALPDAIDLLVVCLEAGQGLDAGLDRVRRDVALRSPALADELEVLSSELRLGQAREQALRQMAQRAGIEEARRLVATLVQADRFGLGMADALRAHAQDLRIRRQLRAEEAAAKMPVKLLFPLIFALFPSLMVVLLGPAVIGVMRQMLPLMAGG